ncbi:MAG: hypothetical protein Q7J72_01775, partial [Candidatus Omnitrophota bacterium]|nr:hypothetical protein [Candidatus Omnitrophota bacterium]
MKKTLYNLIKTGITVVSLTLVLTASAWAGYVQIYQSDKETKSDGTTQRDKILVVVNKGIYSSISASITTYKNDLESEDYYVIVATDEETETETPEQLKDFIKKYYDGTLTSGLTGVVLIGDLPKGTPIYPRKYKKFPDDVFYRDINGDGMTKPDIWLGRIDASKLTKTGKSEKTSLEDYFRRNHNYRIGKADLPSHRGLAYISTGRASFNSLEKAGYDSVTEVLPKDSSTSDFKAKLNDTNGYEWIYLAGTHPGYSGHSGVASSRVTYFYFRKNKDDKGTKLYNTSFYGSDKINPKALFYYLSGVYSGMYTYNDYIAGYCVIGNDYGLAAIVPTGNAAFLAEAFARSNKYFYDKLGRDKNRKNIGEAFLSQSQYLFEQNENSQAVMSSFTTILGDPTLTIDPPIADISEPIIGAINGSEHPVTLSGSGHLNNDTSATITGYAWRSKDDKVSFSDSSSSGPTASLSAGEYTVYFKVKDSYGRWSSEAEKTFTIGSNNTEGPSGTININSDAAYTASTAVTLTLTATHDTGVTGYYVSNSATAPLATDSGWTIVTSTTSYSGSVSHTLSTGDGSKTVYAWYKTAASNVSSAASATITLDTAVPTVTITSPTSDATSSTDKKKLSIGGSASDSTSGIKSVAWSNNKGGGETASGTTSWSAEKTNALSDGDNIITVTATDQAGNTATDTITITYSSATDAGSPSGYVTIKKSGGQTIDSVNGKKYIKSTAVKLSLSASDDKAVKGYYISTSSTEPTALASGWTSISSVSASYSESIDYTLSTGDGEKTIYVWYKDSANKVSTAASDLVTLDAIAPTVSITSPTSDSTYTSISSTISLSGSASDATSGIKSVSWSNSLGGSGTASGTTSWSVSGISLQSGDNVITVTATDYAGKTATDTLTVTYSSSTDTTAPKGSITINSGKMYADSGNVTLNLSATDDKGVTAYYASEDSDTPLSG